MHMQLGALLCDNSLISELLCMYQPKKNKSITIYREETLQTWIKVGREKEKKEKIVNIADEMDIF